VGDKATVAGRISDLSLALSGGSNRSKSHFPINRNRSTVPGWEDASRNTATFAVSREHRAGQGKSGRLNRTGTRQQSGRVMATQRGYGAHQRPVALCAWVGHHEQKDIAGRRILDQPGRAILIDLMVTLSGPLFTRNEK